MLYTITVECPHCMCPCPWTVSAEVEPLPETIFKVICPEDGGPIPIPFRSFKPIDSLPPDTPVEHYPPRPPIGPRWWQFWKW